MAKITILGSGGFGLALAIMCDGMGHEVTVWSAFNDEIETIRRTGELKAKLPGVIIPASIRLTTDIAEAAGKDIVMFGIPSAFVREIAVKVKPFISPNTVIVNTSKGLEDGSLKRMSEVVCEILTDNPVVVLTGPSHAEEVALGIPTTIVAASENIEHAVFVQDALTNKTLRLYVNTDVIGCELGGSLKNIIALAAGICDGLGFGDNTKAALMTRGLSEISRLGTALGAKPETFMGLTGMGDLIVTCTSMHSRNRRAGILIGQGVKPDEAVRRTGTVEGYYCALTAWKLAQRVGIDMPITHQLFAVLFEGKPVSESMPELMGRPHRSETEDVF
ncbi:MAG: NAD(P)H-dependent glycerol-3-phosphate dehydrogenase [Oscillospiraceae bacterium]